ncbi:hypothetical protein J2Z83_000342 [Virgibacillus natechei]|uniref:Cell-wall binding lipoprotein n=1 Tax=Virgibacillus natechei TaxID=1216297 RepID=A0ABS4IBI9_9BACI|nr:YkyA family protein [Virgibacillus natechei]MBP1968250.1 hypothetical protein [Virgibacillus natechei]UZD14481.1 YkyA family protein [Virgibacillus natechei]
MHKYLRKSLIFLTFTFGAILSACSGESTEEQLHNHLEEAVVLEEGFEQQQNEITELERQEQELYSEVIELNMEEFDQIQEISQEAIGIIDQRSEVMELEKESIDASQEEFNNISDLIDDIEEEAVREKIEDMYTVMSDRYSAYDNLYEAYMISLELERELYTMLQQEDIEQEDLTEQITAINDSYQDVLEANDQFNEGTIEYNALKQEFYELSDINVEYEENPASETSDADEEDDA